MLTIEQLCLSAQRYSTDQPFTVIKKKSQLLLLHLSSTSKTGFSRSKSRPFARVSVERLRW